MSKCIFCNLPTNRIIYEYKNFYVIRDAFPVTPLHSLIITKRHVVSYFQCNKDELAEVSKIAEDMGYELVDHRLELFGRKLKS